MLGKFKGWVMKHPNTMAYVAVITTLNFIITILQVVFQH